MNTQIVVQLNFTSSFVSPFFSKSFTGRSPLACMRPRMSSPAPPDEDARRFCSSLADGLAKLEQLLAKDGSPVSLEWSAEAMGLLRTMQAELLAVLKKSKLASVSEDWLDQYMQETAALLDFCNSLKAAVSRFTRYCMVIGLAVHMCAGFSTPRILDDRTELERLERARERFLDVKVVKETLRLGSKIFMGSRKEEKDIAMVMFAAKATMVIISLLLVSAIVAPVSIDMGNGGELGAKIPELSPCLDLLAAIVGRFREKCPVPAGGGRSVLLQEHEMVAEAVRDLTAHAEGGGVADEDRERFLSDVDRLRTRSAGLREGVEKFVAVLDAVFDEVIRGRNDMLGIYRDKALADS